MAASSEPSEQAKAVLAGRYRGENHHRAYRQDFRTPDQLADLIAALANTDGGAIIVGVDHSGVAVGVWDTKIRKYYAAALEQLEPKPQTELELVSDFDHQLAVVLIERSPGLVLTNTGAWVRVGTEVRAMSAAEIRRKLEGVAPDPEPGMVASALARLTGHVGDLQQRLTDRDRAWKRYKEYILGGLIGAVIAWALQWLLGTKF